MGVINPTAPEKVIAPAPKVVTDKLLVLVVASASIVELKLALKPDEGLIVTLVAVAAGVLFNKTARLAGKEMLLFVVVTEIVFCN
jgi:hypothetical protein